MKLIAVLISPIVISFILFISSKVVKEDFCSYVDRILGLLRFSGSQSMGGGAMGCVFYGALVVTIFLIIPISAYIYRSLEVERILRNTNAKNLDKLFLANVVISVSYFSLFFASGASYSEKGEAFVDEIMTGYFLFYLFCVFPWLMMAGMWSLYFKLKIYNSNIRK